MTEMSLFEAIHTQRAIRRYKPDLVPDEAITKIIAAATRAPSARNCQPWHFLVLRDAELKNSFGEIYLKATLDGRSDGILEKDTTTFPKAGFDYAEHIGEFPVLIIVCLEPTHPSSHDPFLRGASIYPAIQNMMLAARALGLGACFTSNYRRREGEVKALLGIPDEVPTAGCIPIGYLGEGEHFGGSRRKPVEEVTFYDRWGQRSS